MEEHNNADFEKGFLITSLTRLKAIDWQVRRDDVENRWLIELMRAFRDNIEKWAAYLRLQRTPLFYNLALHIEPGMALPDHVETWLIESANNGQIPPRYRDGLKNYLYWMQLKALGKIDEKELDLPEPYEPLIQFWEMGGYFTTEHGIMDIWPTYAGFHLWVEATDLK